MARIFEYEPAPDQQAMHGDLPNGILRIAQQEADDDVAPVTSPQDEPFVAAAGDCAVTDQQTVLRLPVLQNDGRGDGQDLEIVSVTQPASGRAVIAEDGTISFTPDQPGHQEITYVVRDASGATSEAKAHIFVNPEGGAIAQPVLQGADAIELAGVARTCVDGMALDIAHLDGDRVVIDRRSRASACRWQRSPASRSKSRMRPSRRRRS
ncbi:MAG: cadherin-like domain-containing protein [Rhizobiales bacterium]|nr:cadherin-like domain-containing protein [Hyphomicrobiales bacterium]